MASIPRLIGSYRTSLAYLAIRPGTPDARAVAGVVRDLAGADALPLPGDVEAPVPLGAAVIVEQSLGRRLLTAYARRVPGRGLFVWYLPRGEHVVLVLVTRTVPAPPEGRSNA